MSENNLKSAVEAMLFASEKPLVIDQLRKALNNLEGNEIRKILEELRTEYEQSNRGLRIVEVAGGFQMITSPDFAPFLKKLFKSRNTERLSKPALETLAIIAYKQPLTRVEIETLRNVNVDGVIKSLVDKNLIRITGRKKVAGRPFVYGTTRQFLEYFGLKSLDELPKMEEFSALVEKSESADIEPIEEKTAEEQDEVKEPAQ